MSAGGSIYFIDRAMSAEYPPAIRANLSESPRRRGGRVAKGGGLLNRCTVKSCTQGSNPCLSASSMPISHSSGAALSAADRRKHSSPAVPLAPGQTVRISLLKELDQILAHIAAQVPSRSGVSCIHEGTQFNGVLFGVGNLQNTHLAIPFVCGFHNPFQFLSHFINGNGVIHIKINRADQVGGSTRPVLKRMVGEI